MKFFGTSAITLGNRTAYVKPPSPLRQLKQQMVLKFSKIQLEAVISSEIIQRHELLTVTKKILFWPPAINSKILYQNHRTIQIPWYDEEEDTKIVM